jgi:hypothetical protein
MQASGRAPALGGLLCASALIVASASHPAAQEAPPEQGWVRDDGRWVETVTPGGTLRVINPHGDIYARFGGFDPQAEVLATIQRLDPELPQLQVRIERPEDDLLVVRSAYPDDAGQGRRDRVDLVVFVPQGTLLDAQTERGLIEAKNLKSDLLVRSVSGDVRIRGIAGRVQAKSERGAISAVLETGMTVLGQDVATETGDIELYLYEDADLEVRIATSGEISTDFSLDVEHRRFEEPGKRAVAQAGKGGPRLDLTSKRGRIRLLRLPRHFRSETGQP